MIRVHDGPAPERFSNRTSDTFADEDRLLLLPPAAAFASCRSRDVSEFRRR